MVDIVAGAERLLQAAERSRPPAGHPELGRQDRSMRRAGLCHGAKSHAFWISNAMSLGLTTDTIRIVSRASDTAIEKMSALPPEEQDRIAQWLFGEFQAEERWTQAFSGSQDALSRLADEARADIKAGRATQLDPDKL